MRVAGAVALVTGANRGLGQAIAAELVARGAATVFAAARDPAGITDSQLVPLRLDITDPDQVAAAASRCRAVDILVNNAGVMLRSPLIGVADPGAARREMEVNYFGTLAMCQAFAPILAANGGGALVNVLSVVSWFTGPFNGSYSASKAAEWSLTNGARIELARQGTQVLAVHSSWIDTEMAPSAAEAKAAPESVARQIGDALEAAADELICDDRSRQTKALLPDDLRWIYPAVQAEWDAAH